MAYLILSIVLIVALLSSTVLALVFYMSNCIKKEQITELLENISVRDKTIYEHNTKIEKQKAEIKALNSRLDNSRNTIAWYQARTKIGNYYIDEFIENFISNKK